MIGVIKCSKVDDLPRQLAFIGHVMVAFVIKYALSVVSDGDFRNVSSSFFHTYVMADCSYDTAIIVKICSFRYF